jgi:hypothetical protein
MAEQTIFDILDRSLGQAIILIMLSILIGYKVSEKAGTILAVTPVGTSAHRRRRVWLCKSTDLGRTLLIRERTRIHASGTKTIKGTELQR